MSRVRATFAVVSLSALYIFSLIYLIGLVAGIDLPWQPYAGTPAYALLFATSLSHALAVIGAATIVAALVVRMFRNQSVRVGFLIAAPAALIHAWSAWQASELVQLSLASIAMASKDFLVVLIAPAGLTALLSYLTRHSSGRASTAA